MHPSKKIIFIIAGIIVSTSFLSGCTLSNIFGTSVTLNSCDICDNDGFAGLNLDFSCTGTITVKTSGSNTEEVDSEMFFSGSHDVILNIGSYRSSINQGQYSIKACDNNDKEVFEKTFFFNGGDLTIDSCDQKWWKREAWKGGYSLIGLIMTVSNNGDVPIYPDTVDVLMDSKTDSGYVLPCVVLPGESKTIKCFVYREDTPSNTEFTVTIKDSDDEILGSASFTVVLEDNVEVEKFSWKYAGHSRSISIPYPDFLFEYYSSLDRILKEDYSFYVFDKYDDDFLRLLSNLLQFSSSTQSDVDKINFAASFIQNLEYKSDVTEDDYPNYPVETLFNTDRGCDCEDMSILTANILDQMGYNVALLRLTGHMAVGIKVGSVPGYDVYDGGYYFLETTSKNHVVGYIPSAYTSKPSLEIYSITSRPLLIHNWYHNNITIYYGTEQGDVVKVTAIVTNLGLATIENVIVEGVFRTQNGLEFNEGNTIPEIKPGMKVKTTILIGIPSNMQTDFMTRVYLYNTVVDEVESAESFQ
jgi:hypothetical protein